MASFTQFTKLPYEIRHTIWALAIPDPEPEVCIVWPLLLIRGDPSPCTEWPALPLTVDTGWPAVMHACSEARELVLSSPTLLRLRHSPVAATAHGVMAVPFRAFDPAIDTLYWDASQSDAMSGFFVDSRDGVRLARELRHVAVEARALYPVGLLGALVWQAAPGLQTLSLVLPDSAGTDGNTAGNDDEDQRRHQRYDDGSGGTAATLRADLTFLPPARRCRLRDLGVTPAASLVQLPWFARPEGPALRVAAFPSWARHELLSCWRATRRRNRGVHQGGSATGAGGPTTGTEDGDGLGGLTIKVQTFVEYRYEESGTGRPQPRWVEVCGSRLSRRGGLGIASVRQQPVRIQPADRRDPEEYRVLDDDCRLEPPLPSRIDEVRPKAKWKFWRRRKAGL